MTPSFISRYSLFFFLLFFFLFISSVLAQSFPSFGFKSFDNKSKSFNSQILLSGDAKLDENGSFVQITQSWHYSAGRVMYREPLKQLGGNGNENGKYSFGTYFSFSLSSENGDGLVFVMLPNRFSSGGYNGKSFGLSNEIIQKKNRSFFVVEIDTKTDTEFGDLNNNHVGINVGSLVSVKVRNASDPDVRLGLNSGKKLQCWIDYEASSKRVEVRMSKAGEKRPVSPLLSYPIDLSEMFKRQEVFMGLSSSNANSSQVCKLYSWSFKLRQVPNWIHSLPLDPETFSKDAEPVRVQQRSDCRQKVLTALILGTACGTLGTYILMSVWSVFVRKQPIAPEDYVVKPVIYHSEEFKDTSDDCKK